MRLDYDIGTFVSPPLTPPRKESEKNMPLCVEQECVCVCRLEREKIQTEKISRRSENETT